MLAARRRGVWFDVGNGVSGHLRWDIVEQVLRAGFWPDTISTDWNVTSKTTGVVDLPNCMSKYLGYGMSVSDVVACATVNAARTFDVFRDRGTLNVGAPADVAVLELRDGEFEFVDNYENKIKGRQRLFPFATVLAGKRVVRASPTKHRLAAAIVLAACLACAPLAAGAQLRFAGNTSTIELAPVLLAAHELGAQRVVVKNGGIPSLFEADAADLATNAETQALRRVGRPPRPAHRAHGRRGLLPRRRAAIRGRADARRPARQADRDRAEHVVRVLLVQDPRDGGSEARRRDDRAALAAVEDARRARAHEIDALTIWEPEIERAAELVGSDAIEFQDRRVYRELFNLHATAASLADPKKRAEIVAFVRELVHASTRIDDIPPTSGRSSLRPRATTPR